VCNSEPLEILRQFNICRKFFFEFISVKMKAYQRKQEFLNAAMINDDKKISLESMNQNQKYVLIENQLYFCI